MLKKIVLILLFYVLAFIPKTVSAENDFSINGEASYNIQPTGNTLVSYYIEIENNKTEKYATSYTLFLNNIKPKNIKVFYKDEAISHVFKDTGENSEIKISFDDAEVGINNKRVLVINFEIEKLTQRAGDIWEISIPKLDVNNPFDNYSLNVSIPKTFGREAYFTPDPLEKSEDENNLYYSFDKAILEKSGITGAFGEFQIFSFVINYHIENPLRRRSSVEIALPPDTSTQRLFYDSLNPKPQNIKVDNDGNWIAEYSLKSRQRLDVSAVGNVQIFTSPLKLFVPKSSNLTINTKDQSVWQSTNPDIYGIANELKTPEKIYDYVIGKLTYDYGRVKPTSQRLGALKALNNPDSAICTEYTDLFIAMSRAAGIPAREINGYAYTENPKIQPLSLVADVLHSWPEYWNESDKVWVPVDPTWEDTSGIDYFSKLDLRHFAFVIHGENPDKPYSPGSYKLGANPQKDVFVNFGQIPKNKNPDIKVESKYQRTLLFSKKIVSKITNYGPSAKYNIVASVEFDGKKVKEIFIEVLPPFSEVVFTKDLDFSFLANKTPRNIEVRADNKMSVLPSTKSQETSEQLFIILFITTAFVIFILKKTNIFRTVKNKK